MQYQLTHNGEIVFTGSENDCYFKLQRSQSHSSDWAMKYEGWKVEPIGNHYETLEALFTATSKGQLTVQNIINKRAYIDGIGWESITVGEELEEQVINMTVSLIGGRGNTPARVRANLLYHKPQHWGLERFIFSRYNNEINLSYVAGQDYTAEIATIRNYLKK